MIQTRLTSFLAGMFTIAATAYVAGNKTPAAMLALGFIAAGILLAGILSSPRRLLRTAARLQQLASLIDAEPTKEWTNNAIVMQDSREPELVSTLMNLGARKPAALAAARYAIAQHPPTADVPTLFKTAMRAPQVAA
jgi:hypothetical protein